MKNRDELITMYLALAGEDRTDLGIDEILLRVQSLEGDMEPDEISRAGNDAANLLDMIAAGVVEYTN